MKPDGSQLELLYGAQSHATGTNGSDVQFLKPRQGADGRMLTIARPFHDRSTRAASSSTSTSPTTWRTCSRPLPNRGVLAGPAQTPAIVNDVRTDDAVRRPAARSVRRIRCSTARPAVRELDRSAGCSRARPIVPCTTDRLATGTAVAAPPLYGIWMYDPRQGTQLPVVPPVEGVLYTEIVALQPQALPPVLLDRIAGVDFDAELETEGVGILDIRSVYDMDGVDMAPGGIAALSDPAQTTAAQRPARFLRIEKAVGLPDEDVRDFANSAFGVTAAFGMREILGYAPVEPDGSVRIKVPANVPFAVTVLDANGRRIGARHDNWLQVRVGEELRCNGCHDTASGESHGRSNLFGAAYDGAPADRPALPEHESRVLRGFRRDHGPGARAYQLRRPTAPRLSRPSTSPTTMSGRTPWPPAGPPMHRSRTATPTSTRRHRPARTA